MSGGISVTPLPKSKMTKVRKYRMGKDQEDNVQRDSMSPRDIAGEYLRDALKRKKKQKKDYAS